jgi:hypothetical protein
VEVTSLFYQNKTMFYYYCQGNYFLNVVSFLSIISIIKNSFMSFVYIVVFLLVMCFPLHASHCQYPHYPRTTMEINYFETVCYFFSMMSLMWLHFSYMFFITHWILFSKLLHKTDYRKKNLSMHLKFNNLPAKRYISDQDLNVSLCILTIKLF